MANTHGSVVNTQKKHGVYVKKSTIKGHEEMEKTHCVAKYKNLPMHTDLQ